MEFVNLNPETYVGDHIHEFIQVILMVHDEC
jgi:hypothetical protein